MTVLLNRRALLGTTLATLALAAAGPVLALEPTRTLVDAQRDAVQAIRAATRLPAWQRNALCTQVYACTQPADVQALLGKLP